MKVSVMIKDCEILRAGSIRSGFVPTCVILLFPFHVSILLIVQFVSTLSRSHFLHVFSLYSHGILHPPSVSRPPSAVNAIFVRFQDGAFPQITAAFPSVGRAFPFSSRVLAKNNLAWI